MPISVQCQCGSSFQAQDHLAGKRVKCPKCQGILEIPSPKMAQKPAPAKPAVGVGAGAANPLLDLLDEAGVEGTKTGPTCPACNADMAPSAVICVSCGYNVMTGTYLDTYVEVDDDADGGVDGGMSNAQKIMAKAEASIDDMPETAKGQDFGDGADAYVVAFGAMAIMAFFVVVGVVVVLTMEQLGDAFGLGYLSFLGFLFLMTAAKIWITVVGFIEGLEHGIATLFIPFYSIYYGFTRGLWWQTGTLMVAWTGVGILFMVVFVWVATGPETVMLRGLGLG